MTGVELVGRLERAHLRWVEEGERVEQVHRCVVLLREMCTACSAAAKLREAGRLLGEAWVCVESARLSGSEGAAKLGERINDWLEGK